MHRRRALLTTVVSGALLLGACSSSSSPSSSTAAASTPTTLARSSSVATTAGAPTSQVAASAGCDAAKGKTVGYSEPLPDPNFKIIESVIQQQLSTSGATLKAVNANLDPNKQISDVQALQQSNMGVLLINPVEPHSVQGVLDAVRKANIPIIVQDTKVGGPYTADVAADVETAATDGAKALADKVGTGKVVAMFGPDFAETLTREKTSFEAAAKADGLNVVETQVNQAITPDGARTIAGTWKQKYGKDLAGIWAFNDTSAVGVASSFDAGFHPTLVSINGQPEAIPLVKDGRIAVTYDLQQEKIGRALAFAALSALCSRPLPATLWVGTKVLDASTVGSWRPPAELAKDQFTVTLEMRGDKTYVAGT